MSPALGDRFLTTGLPGKSPAYILDVFLFLPTKYVVKLMVHLTVKGGRDQRKWGQSQLRGRFHSPNSPAEGSTSTCAEVSVHSPTDIAGQGPLANVTCRKRQSRRSLNLTPRPHLIPDSLLHLLVSPTTPNQTLRTKGQPAVI